MDLNDRPYARYHLKITKNDAPNVVQLLNARQLGISPNRRPLRRQLEQFSEWKVSFSKMEGTPCELPASTRSSFLMTFSHDCSKVASAHGDHNIYVSDVKTGKHIQKLVGHRRTPWSIAFHPTCNNILASGCLSGEVRVWELEGGSERWRADPNEPITSLAFHPVNQLLVIATSTYLYFWDWSQSKPEAWCSTNSFDKVRYVKFDRYGHRLITGIFNSFNSMIPRFTGSTCHHSNTIPPMFPYDGRDRLSVATPSSSSPELQQFLNSVVSPAVREDLAQAMHTLDMESFTFSEAYDISNDAERVSSGEAEENLYGEDEGQARVINEHSYNLEPPELVYFMSGEFWNMCSRLRTTCLELERRLVREVLYSEDDEMESRPGPSSSDENNSAQSSSPSSGYADPYGSIIAMLIRIRRGLYFSSLSLANVRHRVDMVRCRIREIISRIRYWNIRRYFNSNTQINPDIFNGLEEIADQLDEQIDNLVRMETRFENVLSTSDENLMELQSYSPDDPAYIALRNNISSGPSSSGARADLRDSFVDAQLPSTSRAHDLSPFPTELRINTRSDMNFFQEDRLSPSRYWEVIDDDPPSPEPEELSDDSDRPATPPLLMPSPDNASAFHFDSSSTMCLRQAFSQNFRIQSWDFTKFAIPPIYDVKANIVVRRCIIHNDCSIDISQDGEKIVALVPPQSRDNFSVRFGIYSLKPKNLGQTLCIWGYVTNVISLSFSPLANYLLIGYAYSRTSYSEPEKKVVAQIVKINPANDKLEEVNIRSFTHMTGLENRSQSVGLNAVQWLPQSGHGFAYATNRGTLCIVKPKDGNIHRIGVRDPEAPRD